MELLHETFYIEDLLLKKINEEQLTATEQNELEIWKNNSEENYHLYRELTSKALLITALNEFEEPDTEKSLKEIYKMLFHK